MQYLHQLLGTAILAVAALYLVVAVLAAWLDRWHPPLARSGAALTGLLAVQAAVGAIRYLSGARPEEGLHLLYGLAIVGLMPLAATFASEAPPRSKSAVTGVAAGLALLLAWRLLSTG